MLEDDIYRTSTQYRLWSFTKESLNSIRENTNSLASVRVRDAIRRAQEARPATSTPGGSDEPDSKTNTPAGPESEIECLTPEDELELVQYYCEKTLELGDEYKPPLPTTVRATAIQYLRRFYVTNSPMTYHPKSIMPCALFLATKTDNYYMSLRSFAEKIPNTTAEDIIAPEFLLTQGLRFAFDIRHPFRGLEGGVMELTAIAKGEGAPGPHHPEQTAAKLQEAIQAIPPAEGAAPSASITDRIASAHGKTRQILKTAAQMTDAYFLYTPSQIWLSALLLVDQPLLEFYLDTKLGPAPSGSPPASAPESALAMLFALRAKLTGVLESCSTLLGTYLNTHDPNVPPGPARMKNLKRIGKKLYHCQNPEKFSELSAGRTQRREGSGSTTPALLPTAGGGDVDETEGPAVKKRKLEKEAEEAGNGGNK
uniref:Cyclin-dependent protein kinase regulator n=1 Tax=Coccidioides posadasii RMSCC 3488 TaxID=454284 RepID=A0A0J6F2L5_COCPO|nr:cyclin-dependent protein kinase regulator [Coccidioides posadasii RMSCC 3488]